MEIVQTHLFRAVYLWPEFHKWQNHLKNKTVEQYEMKNVRDWNK